LMRQLRRQLRRNTATKDPFGRELAAALRCLAAGQKDFVLLHSVSAANLADLGEAVAPAMLGRLMVVLRRTPENMDTDDAGPRPIVSVLRHLHDIYGCQLKLHADTCLLARAFREQTGMSV